MLTLLTFSDLRTELSSVHSARSDGRLDWDAYVAATDMLNDALVSVRDLGPIKTALDAMAIAAEIAREKRIIALCHDLWAGVATV